MKGFIESYLDHVQEELDQYNARYVSKNGHSDSHGEVYASEKIDNMSNSELLQDMLDFDRERAAVVNL